MNSKSSNVDKWKEKQWTKSVQLCMDLMEVKFGKITRESNVMPGVPVGHPVKILKVNPPVESFRTAGLPYVKVLIELPNGETRAVSGEVLKRGNEKMFHKFAKLYAKMA